MIGHEARLRLIEFDSGSESALLPEWIESARLAIKNPNPQPLSS
jgi:hypothetical protein